MSIDSIIDVNNQARSLDNIEITEYALKNPYKWDSDFLRAVLKQYQFLSKLEHKIPIWHENKKLLGAEMVNIEPSIKFCTS